MNSEFCTQEGRKERNCVKCKQVGKNPAFVKLLLNNKCKKGAERLLEKKKIAKSSDKFLFEKPWSNNCVSAEYL